MTEFPRLEDDFRVKAVEARLKAIADATANVRYAFAVCVVIAGTLSLVEWNAFLPTHRVLAAPLPTITEPKGVDEPVPDLRRTIRAMWVESTFVTVPLLNVKIGINDVAVLGTFTLFIMSMWWYWCVRREHHAIATLLRDTYHDAALSPFIYHTIADAAFILDQQDGPPFTTLRSGATNVTGVDRRSFGRRVAAAMRFVLWPFSMPSFAKFREADLYGRFLNMATGLLVFLPSAAGVVLLAGDISSLFTPSLFVVPGRSAFQALGARAIASYALANWVPGTAFVILTTRNCSLIRFYQTETEHAIRQYGRNVTGAEANNLLRAATTAAIQRLGPSLTLERVTQIIRGEEHR